MAFYGRESAEYNTAIAEVQTIPECDRGVFGDCEREREEERERARGGEGKRERERVRECAGLIWGNPDRR